MYLHWKPESKTRRRGRHIWMWNPFVLKCAQKDRCYRIKDQDQQCLRDFRKTWSPVFKHSHCKIQSPCLYQVWCFFENIAMFASALLVIRYSTVPLFSELEVSHYSGDPGNELITCWECVALGRGRKKGPFSLSLTTKVKDYENWPFFVSFPNLG